MTPKNTKVVEVRITTGESYEKNSTITFGPSEIAAIDHGDRGKAPEATMKANGEEKIFGAIGKSTPRSLDTSQLQVSIIGHNSFHNNVRRTANGGEGGTEED
jgi:hypothetical protein